MKINYEAPSIEVIDVELEGVLCGSGIPNCLDPMGQNDDFGDDFGDEWLKL